MSYYEESLKPRSEKITFVTIESVERAKLFTANGDNWDRLTNHFVVGVREDGELIPTGIDTWYFIPQEKKLRIIGGADPKTRNITLVYRHFFSTAPMILPWDLDSDVQVEWEPRVISIGSIGQQLDSENTGIVLESSSSVDLINSDGFFDSTFDTHIWENQSIKFYSWFPSIPISEKVQLFEGVIESKSFTEQKVTFRVRDFVYKLKNRLQLGVFNSDDRTLPAFLNKSKRRIYGQADGVQCLSMNATLEGYYIGTISGSVGSLIITGDSTFFLSKASPGDELFFKLGTIDHKIAVESVDSDTQMTLTKELEISIPAGTDVFCKPAVPYRFMNRPWYVAGHRLRAAEAEILIVVAANCFIVDKNDEFFPDDEIVINGIQSTVRRVSGRKIYTNTNIVPNPVAGNKIIKRPIKKAFIGSKELVYERDYIEENYGDYCLMVLQTNAEFNIADQRLVGVNLTWTNGTRVLTTSSTVDLRTILKSRDWIRSSSVSRPDWYEILSVSQQQVTLRTVVSVSGGPYTEGAYYKAVDVVTENSLITVNCLGMEWNNTWVKTPSDVVRHLVLNDAGFAQVNEEAFAKAKTDCDYIMSLVLPETLGNSEPTIRDVITLVNESVFGSLYGDTTNNISFSILNSMKPGDEAIIRDDDILSFSVDTSQKIVNNVTVNYRPFVDRFSGEATFKDYVYDSPFVNEMIGIKNATTKRLYIYEDDKAIIIAQRIALFNSLSNSTIRIKGKMNLAQIVVNDKIYLELDRLFARFGGRDKRKLGIVSGVKRDGFNTELSVTDLGNIYNRVPSIAPTDSNPYTEASQDEKMRYGYILDNDTLTPDETSEEGLGNFIIG